MQNSRNYKMHYGTVAKIIIMMILLIAANAIFGMICHQANLQYELLFSPTIDLLYLVLWILGAIAVVVTLTGTFVSLARPYWVTVVAFALSALALVYFFRTSVIISIVLWLFYMLLAILSSRSVKSELNNRLDFSVNIIRQKLGLFAQLLILFICLSFSLGYRTNALSLGYVIPPQLKQTISETVSPFIQSQIEAQSGIPIEGMASELEKVNEITEQLFQKTEAFLQPYAKFVWLYVAFVIFAVLNTIQLILSWIPWLLMNIVFGIFRLFGMAKIVTEKRDKKRLILR